MSARHRLLALVAIGLLASGGAALPSRGEACDEVVMSEAQGSGADAHGEDGDCRPSASTQDRARAAVEAGHVAPLAEALKAFAEGWPGDILRVELEQHGKEFVYEAKILDPSGRRREIVLDGKTLAIISEE